MGVAVRSQVGYGLRPIPTDLPGTPGAPGVRTNAVALLKDYRQPLAGKDIDAVTIATPDHWHALMAVHACQAGKDVYSEKPTCKTMQEGEAMINASNYYKRVVQ